MRPCESFKGVKQENGAISQKGLLLANYPTSKKKNNNNPLVTQAGHVFMKVKYQLKVKLNEKKKVKHATLKWHGNGNNSLEEFMSLE